MNRKYPARLVPSLLAIACIFTSPYAWAADSSAPLAQITEALDRGDAPTVQRLANAALQNDILTPHDAAQIYLDLGVAYQRLGKLTDSLAAFTKAADIQSLTPVEQAFALFDRGVTLDAMGQTNDAIRDYTAAIALRPGFAGALNNRANVYRIQSRFADAKRDYRASLATGGSEQREYPYYGLGRIAEAEGDKAGATEYYRLAVVANPKYEPALQRLTALGAGAAPNVVASRPPNRQVAPLARGEIGLSNRQPDMPPQSESGKTPKLEIQLGAWRSERQAEEAWKRLARRAGDLLGGLTPRVVVVNLPGRGRYYRLRAGTVARGGAEKICAALSEMHIGCVPVRD